MKSFSSYFILMSFFLFMATSCQKEETQLLEGTPENGAIPDAAVDLLESISLNDGSFDNVVDAASCIELVLPLTVNVNNAPVTIRDKDDYQTIEFLIEEHDDDEDTITLDFPIEIRLADHTVVNVPDQATLDSYANSCSEENAQDDDIESIDPIYPLTFATFNTNTDDTSMSQVASDKELHDFMMSMSPEEIVSLDFPVQMQRWDSTLVSLMNYVDLQNEIEAADANYDEDDDNDYNDDDTVTISEAEFSNLLFQCGWSIKELEVNGESLENSFNGYHFEFYAYDNVVTGCLGNELSVGHWDLTTVNGNLRLSLDFDDLDHINRNWIVHELVDSGGDDTTFALRLGEDILDFEMDCFDQTPDIIALLSSDSWGVYYFQENSQNNTAAYTYYEFTFNGNSSITIYETVTQMTTAGNWAVNNFGLELDLFFGDQAPLDALTDANWNILYYTDNYLEIHKDNGDILVLEKL